MTDHEQDEEDDEPYREGYVFVGNVKTDHAQLVVGDPLYLLPKADGSPSWFHVTAEDALAVLANKLGGGFVQSTRGETLAVTFHTGYGDGTFPVFCKLNDERRLVEVVIDMSMTPFQRAVFEQYAQEQSNKQSDEQE